MISRYDHVGLIKSEESEESEESFSHSRSLAFDYLIHSIFRVRLVTHCKITLLYSVPNGEGIATRSFRM